MSRTPEFEFEDVSDFACKLSAESIIGLIAELILDEPAAAAATLVSAGETDLGETGTGATGLTGTDKTDEKDGTDGADETEVSVLATFASAATNLLAAAARAA